MGKASIEKLMEAGYSFLKVWEREVENGKKEYVIKIASEYGTWRFLNVLTSKTATRKELDRLVSKTNSKYLF